MLFLKSQGSILFSTAASMLKLSALWSRLTNILEKTVNSSYILPPQLGVLITYLAPCFKKNSNSQCHLHLYIDFLTGSQVHLVHGICLSTSPSRLSQLAHFKAGRCCCVWPYMTGHLSFHFTQNHKDCDLIHVYITFFDDILIYGSNYLSDAC